MAKNDKINNEAKRLETILAENNVIYVQGGYSKGLIGLTLKFDVLNSVEELKF